MITERSLPANVEAERAILGVSILDRSNTTFDQALAKLTASDFSLDSHRRLFSSMAELSEAGKPIDFVTLCDHLISKHELEAIGGTSYVIGLTDGRPVQKNIEHYVRIVKDKSVKRTLVHVCSRTIDQCCEDTDPASQIASMHDDELMELIGERSKDSQHVSEFSDDVVTQIFNIRAKGDVLAGFSYGVGELDAKTTGVRRKEFTIIGGRPKDGKTALLLEAIQANCEAGSPVGFFSIEMNREAILERLYSSVGKINFRHIREPHLLTEEEAARLLIAKQRVDEWPLYIDDDAEVTISEICARARLMKKRHGVNLVGVDYMQIVNGRGDIRQRMIKISRSLRTLAKMQDMAVIGLSQLARPNDKNMNRRPEIWDLKESGSLEADANTILLIFRPVDETGHKSGDDEILITQRGGEAGIAVVTYLGKWMRFEHRTMKGF